MSNKSKVDRQQEINQQAIKQQTFEHFVEEMKRSLAHNKHRAHNKYMPLTKIAERVNESYNKSYIAKQEYQCDIYEYELKYLVKEFDKLEHIIEQESTENVIKLLRTRQLLYAYSITRTVPLYLYAIKSQYAEHSIVLVAEKLYAKILEGSNIFT